MRLTVLLVGFIPTISTSSIFNRTDSFDDRQCDFGQPLQRLGEKLSWTVWPCFYFDYTDDDAKKNGLDEPYRVATMVSPTS